MAKDQPCAALVPDPTHKRNKSARKLVSRGSRARGNDNHRRSVGRAGSRSLDPGLRRCPDSRLLAAPRESRAVKIATWNVNSVKVRLPHLLDYLKSAQPDVLCLQEIKCLADDFPRLEVASLGYRVEALGQRAYNGVALIYLPNGNPSDDATKFNYKLAWMDRLNEHASGLLRREIPFVLAGDYNICPTDDDVYDPVAFRDDALCRIESRSRFRALLYRGLTDCYRVFHPEPHKYTYWD